MTDEELTEIREGLEKTQERMRGYAPGDVARAFEFNEVSRFDRIVADTYALKTVPALLAEVERLREAVTYWQGVAVRREAENARDIAALREIARAVATMPLVYVDELLEYECPFPDECNVSIPADWGETPMGVNNREWAAQRIRHTADCPVPAARKLLGMEPGRG